MLFASTSLSLPASSQPYEPVKASKRFWQGPTKRFWPVSSTEYRHICYGCCGDNGCPYRPNMVSSALAGLLIPMIFSEALCSADLQIGFRTFRGFRAVPVRAVAAADGSRPEAPRWAAGMRV